MELYPLLMSPAFQYGSDTPWGGTMLREIFMKDAPEGPVGASLETSTLDNLDSLVASGLHAGKSLARMAALWGDSLTGGGGFPFVVKLLDTVEPFSVQVCPEGRPGGGAAWVILNAEPGAGIVYGLKDGFDPAAPVTEDCLNWVPVRPGDVFYVPAGLAHAIGAGVLCYEVRETGAPSYRLFDWNRGRQLHREQALEALVPDMRLTKNEGTTALCRGGSRTYYISDDRFELCRLNLSGKMPLESGRLLILTALASCKIRWNGGECDIAPFATVVVPAALEGAVLEGNAKLMMTSLPDREALKALLGYRAENVAGLL